jgi:hypothetical protein
VIRLALRKPHWRDSQVQSFAAAFSETDRAHQTSRNALPARAGEKTELSRLAHPLKEDANFSKTVLSIHRQPA